METTPVLLRSFVRRERRSKQQQLAENLVRHYTVDPTELAAMSAYFKQTSSLTLEIGFGTGDSLFKQAQSNPDQGYIGIEVYKTGIIKLLRRLEQTPLDNLKVVEGDAVSLLANHIPTQSLDAIQILFPDPWPKRRHHKRRLIQPTVISLLHHALKPQGRLYLATDWEPYAKEMLALLEASSLMNQHGCYQFSARPSWMPLTKFEQRGQRLNHRIFYLVFSRCQSISLPLFA